MSLVTVRTHAGRVLRATQRDWVDAVGLWSIDRVRRQTVAWERLLWWMPPLGAPWR